MAQTQKVGTTATSIFTDDDGKTKVVYHSTVVVSFDVKEITLKAGGWMTATTKARMNQAANQFRLRFSVRQKDYDWFVTLPSGEEVPFAEGMTFPR